MKSRTVFRVCGVVVAVLVVAALGVRLTGPGQSDRATLVGYFTDASPLIPGSEIRTAGVRVGNVASIELQNGQARVTFEVDRSVLPVHQDARMVIRPVNLLGERYVELDVGSASKPYLESAELPVDHTSSRVSLQDVLNTFDDPTSAALAVMVTTLGEGMRGSGSDVAAALKALKPTMDNTNRLVKILDEQNAVLTSLIDQVTPVARGLAADKGNVLERTVASTERMLSTVAAKRKALSATLAELPDTLASARRTLRNLAGAAKATTPTLKAIRPVTDDLTQVTKELHRFANAADPALTALKPVLERANKLLDQAAPAVEKLRKAGPDLRSVASDLRPVGNVVLNRHLGDLMKFVKKWSLATNGRDALGNYFRGVLWVTPRTLQDMLASPLATEGRQDPPGGKVTGPPGSQKPAPPKGPAQSGGERDDSKSATGLSKQQEQSLLGQLLGGS